MNLIAILIIVVLFHNMEGTDIKKITFKTLFIIFNRIYVPVGGFSHEVGQHWPWSGGTGTRP